MNLFELVIFTRDSEYTLMGGEAELEKTKQIILDHAKVFWSTNKD